MQLRRSDQSKSPNFHALTCVSGTRNPAVCAGVGEALGTTVKSSPPLPDQGRRVSRAKRYRAQTHAQIVLKRQALSDGLPLGKKYPGDVYSTIDCLRTSLGFVGVQYDSVHAAAHYSGIVTCGSVWACPVCAAKIQERRRGEIEEAMTWAQDQGLKAVLVTFTFPHKSWHKLEDLLRMQSEAFKRLRRGNPFEKLKKQIGFQGLIRSLEVTHGQNGWHPHTHEIWLVDPKAPDFYGRLVELWQRACVRAGLLDLGAEDQVKAFQRHSVDVKENVTSGDYLAKQDNSRQWDFSREVAKATSKEGRLKGVHPHHFLVRQEPGDDARYVEYVKSMKGKRQLFWSHGLKKRVGIGELSDEELAQQEREKSETIAKIERDDWKLVCGNDCRAELLDIAEDSGAAGIAELIESLKFDPGTEPPDPDRSGPDRGGSRGKNPPPGGLGAPTRRFSTGGACPPGSRLRAGNLLCSERSERKSGLPARSAGPPQGAKRRAGP